MKPKDMTPEGRAASRMEHRSPRRSLVSMAWYRTLPLTEEEPPESAHEGVAASIDLSKRGIGIFTPRPLPVGVLVFVEVAFRVLGSGATASPHVSIVGRIVHCAKTEDGSYRVGIQMEVVPPNDRAILERLLEQ